MGTKDSLTYLFTFALSETDTGVVEITLPRAADDETTEVAKAATEFEGVLVGYGFLAVGLVADADDMVRAVREAAGRAAGKLSAKTDARVEGGERGGGTRFSDTTHRIVGSVAEGGGKLAEVSGRISSAVSGATFEAGRWVGGKFGGGPPVEQNSEEKGRKSLPRETVEQALEAAGVAASGLEQGYGFYQLRCCSESCSDVLVISAACVSSTVGESASRTAEHEHGEEAKELVEGARKAAQDAGKVVVDATLATSAVWQAGEAGRGAGNVGGGQMEARRFGTVIL